jgi:hypothetical protein
VKRWIQSSLAGLYARCPYLTRHWFGNTSRTSAGLTSIVPAGLSGLLLGWLKASWAGRLLEMLHRKGGGKPPHSICSLAAAPFLRQDELKRAPLANSGDNSAVGGRLLTGR